MAPNKHTGLENQIFRASQPKGKSEGKMEPSFKYMGGRERERGINGEKERKMEKERKRERRDGEREKEGERGGEGKRGESDGEREDSGWESAEVVIGIPAVSTPKRLPLLHKHTFRIRREANGSIPLGKLFPW